MIVGIGVAKTVPIVSAFRACGRSPTVTAAALATHPKAWRLHESVHRLS
jgi:hypothetical protein